MSSRSGFNYEPQGIPRPVVKPGEFPFAAIGLDHGHIWGMTQGLVDAGGQPAWVFDSDAARCRQFVSRYPSARVARSEDEVLQDPSVKLVACAAVPALRCGIGVRAQDHGKHYFSDKAPFTTAEQLERARRKVEETGLVWAAFYSERLHNESAVHAGDLVRQGAIGKVIHVLGLGPHRMDAPSRPAWFFRKDLAGGILTDVGSHQVEQFLFYTDAKDADVTGARVANFHHPQFPDLEDFGDASLVADTGAAGYFRVDWFTPDGLRTWGDGRTVILGTEGTIELRKYIDVARDPSTDHLFLVDSRGEHYLNLKGKVGFPFFGRLILDCLNGTQTAMPQAHTFKAAELCLAAQARAVRIPRGEGRG